MSRVKDLEGKLSKLRKERTALDEKILKADAELDLAKQEIARITAGQTLIELATTYNQVQAEYHEAVLNRINSCDPLKSKDLEEFWAWLEKLGQKVEYWIGGNFDPVKRAVDNVIWDILNEDNWSMESWERCGRLVATYNELVGKLSKHCWEMKGVEKSDDGYSDWTDCLPLAGRKVVEGILSDDLATFKQVGAAIKRHRPKLVDLIQNGENYVRGAMDDVMEEYFTNVVRRLEDDEED